MATRIPVAVAILMADAAVDYVDTGAGTATMEIRTGTQPTNGDDAASGTLLVTFNLPNPAFGGAADQNPHAKATLNGVPISGTGVAAGTAGWGRVYNRNGDPVFDGAVGAEITLDNTSIAISQTVNLTAATFQQNEQ